MKIMNWLLNLLGYNDKEQRDKAREVSEYVQDKKLEYKNTMKSAKREAKDQHKQTRQMIQESAKLNRRTLDVTEQIYLVTGHR